MTMVSAEKRKILLGVTGASGMIFLRSFTELLTGAGENVTVHGICSPSGEQVVRHELGLQAQELRGVSVWFNSDDFAAAPSSGSSGYDAMVILPCTMGTLGAIAAGLSHNLIHRAADVMLKERKKLVLAVRETPLNRSHLKNMLAVDEAGGIIFPPMPAYYLKPQSLDEAALTYCWRLAEYIGIPAEDRRRWEGNEIT